jgi:hypothetical protein
MPNILMGRRQQGLDTAQSKIDQRATDDIQSIVQKEYAATATACPATLRDRGP